MFDPGEGTDTSFFVEDIASVGSSLHPERFTGLSCVCLATLVKVQHCDLGPRFSEGHRNRLADTLQNLGGQ